MTLVLRGPALVGRRQASGRREPAGLGEQLLDRASRRSGGPAPLPTRSPRRLRPARSPRARSCRAASTSDAPAAATAQSPTRRSTFSYALPALRCSGTRTSSSISSPATAVRYGPRLNSSISTTRSPSGPRITIRASSAAHTADRSSDGSAWHSAPPIVPRLRTTGSAITRSASVKIASRVGEQL